MSTDSVEEAFQRREGLPRSKPAHPTLPLDTDSSLDNARFNNAAGAEYYEKCVKFSFSRWPLRNRPFFFFFFFFS
jgi:hypothetical protein